MNIKNEVLYRVYIVLSLVTLFGAAILVKAFKINYIEGNDWRAQGKEQHIQEITLEDNRGNIVTEDGSLLATSLPFFDIHFDAEVPSDELFNENVDSLAVCLARYVNEKDKDTDEFKFTAGGYKDYLVNGRQTGKRYLFIKKNATFEEYERIKKFPIFNQGQYQGGFIAEEKFQRRRPYRLLARRTVGYIRKGTKGSKDKKVGLEGYFDDILKGSGGKRIKVYRSSAKTFIPVDDFNKYEMTRGDDVITTIDINLQEIVQKALRRGLEHTLAESGSAIVMEVKTGKVKAIANLGRHTKGWYEDYNYAVGEAVEPGSTFKLATIMALLEDGYVDLDDTINLNQGYSTFYNEEMRDASYHQLDSTSIRTAFEISSNVAFADLVQKHYGDIDVENGDKRWIQHLKNFRLNQPVGIEIHGEDNPYVKEAQSKEDDWSGITLPWMSIGYEVELTPLQLLTFYNAVANDGKLMKPYLVSETQHFGETLKKFKPTVIKKQIAKPSTIKKVKELLEGVVENGTAKKLKSNRYRFAGKTGTAQMNYYKFDRREDIKYRASFVGYFPAENPIYSCMVLVEEPKQNGKYGSEVAGPIFREIADNCFVYQHKLYPVENGKPKNQFAKNELPQFDVGYKKDVVKVLHELDLDHNDRDGVKNWAVLAPKSDTLNIRPRYVSKDVVPNVVGMGLRDALYVLENLGLKVTFEGAGKVKRQSLKMGTKIRGQTIKLTLQ